MLSPPSSRRCALMRLDLIGLGLSTYASSDIGAARSIPSRWMPQYRSSSSGRPPLTDTSSRRIYELLFSTFAFACDAVGCVIGLLCTFYVSLAVLVLIIATLSVFYMFPSFQTRSSVPFEQWPSVVFMRGSLPFSSSSATHL